MTHTDIEEFLEDGLDLDDGFECGTCGTGFKTFRERIENAANALAEETGQKKIAENDYAR